MKANIIVGVVIVILLVAGTYPLSKKKVSLPEKTEVSRLDIIDVLPADAIPAIDNPKFETVADAEKWLKESDLVFGLSINEKEKAFPQRILNWHEVVNNPEGITVTFCPLCGSAVAYKSPNTTFGVSGKLYNSDLVMYDRATQTLWSQITGEGISGKLVGQRLEKVSIQTLRWSEWKKMHPNSLVLSRDTGFARDYNIYPYGNYETSSAINFSVKTRDNRLFEKAVVWGVAIDGNAKAYPEEKLKNSKTEKLKDKIGNTSIELFYKDGKLEVKRLDTKEEVVPTRNFWFAWVAFYPTTELY